MTAPTAVADVIHSRRKAAISADGLVALLMWLGHGESLGPYLIDILGGEPEPAVDEPAGQWATDGEPGPETATPPDPDPGDGA